MSGIGTAHLVSLLGPPGQVLDGHLARVWHSWPGISQISDRPTDSADSRWHVPPAGHVQVGQGAGLMQGRVQPVRPRRFGESCGHNSSSSSQESGSGLGLRPSPPAPTPSWRPPHYASAVPGLTPLGEAAIENGPGGFNKNSESLGENRAGGGRL